MTLAQLVGLILLGASLILAPIVGDHLDAKRRARQARFRHPSKFRTPAQDWDSHL